MRHAYLIIAYEQLKMLERLIWALDDPRNDIFVHIDKKAKFSLSSDPSSSLSLGLKFSSIYFIPSIDARWGDVSLVEVELNLIEAALQHGPYSYLHLLSDSDFPIKSQDYIHAECERLAGQEFIGYAREGNVEKEIYSKVRYYYFFTKKFRENTLPHRAYKYLYTRVQKCLGINRGRGIDFKRGSQWCSFTMDFATYVNDHRQEIERQYHRTYCPDEIFMQTLCWNSNFRERLYNLDDEFEGCKRYVNWHGRDIHWIDEENIDDMMASDRWFARKFMQRDMGLVEMVDKKINDGR